MISSINILLAFLWVCSAVVDYSDFCYLWQLKEYRIDRMRDFMSTEQGKQFWRRYVMIWRSGIAIVIFFWPINSIPMLKYFLLAIFGFELFKNIYFGTKHKLRHPVFTKKALILIFGAIFIEGFLFVLTRDWTLLFLLMILRFFTLSVLVYLFMAPTLWMKKYYIGKASKKLSRYKKLTIIGITGSYGKTSVKNFLSHILGGKHRVIKTPKNINTEIGIANFIRQYDFSDVDIFVVEMGAYKIGDIKMICDMVKPKIGILTAISEQHLSLFGNIKQTQSAKYELLRSLPSNGLAVVNIDNPYCREFIHELKCKVYTFGVDLDFSPNCLIKDVAGDKDGLSCSGELNNNPWKLVTPLVGAHNATNLAPCILVANYLGLSNELIFEQCKTIERDDNTIKMYKYGNSTVIDDSYNSNFNGFCAALDILSTFSSASQRVVITRGILELGEKSDELHEKIGEEIAYVADKLIVINKDFEEPLRRGVGSKFNTEVLLIDDPEKLKAYITDLKNQNAAILFENRVPAIIHDEILNTNESK